MVLLQEGAFSYHEGLYFHPTPYYHHSRVSYLSIIPLQSRVCVSVSVCVCMSVCVCFCGAGPENQAWDRFPEEIFREQTEGPRPLRYFPKNHLQYRGKLRPIFVFEFFCPT